jgi:hypothetical protein
VLQRFVNFMNNPDERTAIEQFGKGDKYIGCMLMMVTLPGLPMIGHGQIEGFTEKYGMEYRRAYWDEMPDEDLVRRHERDIFPLMRRRGIFSGAEHFALFDFETDGGWVDENVFAYTNRDDGGKALIMFNNAIERTAGRVRLASAVNTGSADQPLLVRRSLAEALGLDTSPGVWHLYRDHLEGHEYLRSGHELAQSGLHAPLQGYQARAFVDWRAVHDIDGTWARLADQLRGGGTPDLGRARRRLQLEGELSEVRRWLSPAVLSWLESAALPAPLPADEAAAAAAEPPALAELPRGLADWARALHRVPALLPRLAADPTLGARTRQDLTAWLQALPGSRSLEVTYLAAVLRSVRQPGEDRRLPRAPVPPADADLVAEDLTALLQEWSGREYQATRDACLAEAVAIGDEAVRSLAAGHTDWLAAALAQPVIARAAGVNTHEGRQWLVEEDLKALLQVMMIEALARDLDVAPDVAPAPTPAAARLTALLDAQALILKSALDAGYRLDKLIRTWNGPDPS